jgi:hypothetical protein
LGKILHCERIKGTSIIQENEYAIKKKENMGCCCIKLVSFFELDDTCPESFEEFIITLLSTGGK